MEGEPVIIDVKFENKAATTTDANQNETQKEETNLPNNTTDETVNIEPETLTKLLEDIKEQQELLDKQIARMEQLNKKLEDKKIAILNQQPQNRNPKNNQPPQNRDPKNNQKSQNKDPRNNQQSQNRDLKGKNVYTDSKGQKQIIPFPIREELNLIYDSENRKLLPEAEKIYAAWEEHLYNERFNERVRALRSKGWTTENINNYMEIEKYNIKLEILPDLQNMITNDIRQKVIKRISENPTRYASFIDPKTGKPIEFRKGEEDIIKHILQQRIFTKQTKNAKQARQQAIKQQSEPKNKFELKDMSLDKLITQAALAGWQALDTSINKTISQLAQDAQNVSNPEEADKIQRRKERTQRLWKIIKDASKK